MTVVIPELNLAIPDQLNLADWFLRARVRQGDGDRIALRTDDGNLSYAEVDALASRFAHVLQEAGVRPEERVIVALPDGPEWVGAFFGILRLGGVVVMVNPGLGAEEIEYFYRYTRARAAIVDVASASTFLAAMDDAPSLQHLLPVGDPAFDETLAAAPDSFEDFPGHRDDAAIWLFSGGTTGKPKAVVQTAGSFVNTTALYAHGVIGYRPDDITISVPKLYFGYATGSNLLFPFSVGASVVLFPDRCTPEALFERIERHRPTILVNVPTMVGKMLDDPAGQGRDISSVRLATSAGEALPIPLHERWNATYGIDLLDGLGTAEQWHIFISNRPGDVRPGTLGKVVPGFDVRVRDEDGNDLPDGEIGALWVRGGSRAIAYWQRHERTQRAFRGEWYVSGDMVLRNADGTFVYCGRGDDMLKVSGKWLAPGEVESCLQAHDAVREVAVVGVELDGLVKPKAFIVPAPGSEPGAELAAALQEHVRATLEPYKYPREVEFLDDFPRTHLGKIDRGALKRKAGAIG